MKKEGVRLLHRRSQYGYTDRPERAMHAEPEAVPAEAQEWITSRVRRSEREAQLLRWRERRAEIEKQIDQLYATRFMRANINKELRQLRRQLARIDRKLEVT